MNHSVAVGLVIALSSWTWADESQFSSDRLFAPDRLLDIQIEMEDAEWDRIRYQSRSIFRSLTRHPSESPFTYSKASVTIDGKAIHDVGVRKKGFLGSLDEERPSLKIRFDKYADQSPFGAIDRLTLNNNKQDASRLSQYLSYKLFNDSGTAASRCNFARVTVNGRYLGIYSNVESVKPAMLERAFGDGSGALFEGTVADMLGESVERFEAKTDDDDLDDLRAIGDILEAESVDLELLEQQLDVKAFVRFWAMESLIGFWDGYNNNQNNFFMYQNPFNSKYYFLPWGTDSAFSYSVPRQLPQIRHKSVHTHSVLANRLYRRSPTRQMYRDTLEDLLATHWNEQALLAEIDRVVTLIEGDVHKRNTGFEKAVDKVRSFITGRRRRVERELERWPMPLKTGPREPVFATEIGRGHATFSTVWYAKSPNKPESQGKLDLELTMEDEPVRFRQIGVTAEPSKEWSWDRKKAKPPTLVLTGIRESDGKRLTLVLGASARQFRSSTEPVGMFGVLIEGGMLLFVAKAVLNPAGLTLVDGSVTFEQASMEPGAPVEGELQMTLMKFGGGKFPKEPWEEEAEAP